jgi:serine/threonine protein phosphatase PrpC
MTMPRHQRLTIVGAMLTDVGQVRSSNEDAVAYVTPAYDDPASDRGALALVADGMGGHAAGEIASALAAEVVRGMYFALDVPAADALATAFEAANRAILDRAEADPACQGMGTTCTAIAVQDNMAYLAHVGDSRAYLLREGLLTQLSEDQSLHAQLIRDGVLTKEEAETQPGRNYILQALGTKTDVTPAIWREGLRLYPGDVLVLCSDGLTNLVSDALIAEIAGHPQPQEACRRLVDAACDAGGHDNISVGIFWICEPEGRAVDAPAATRRLSAFRLDNEREPGSATSATRIIKVPAVSS